MSIAVIADIKNKGVNPDTLELVTAAMMIAKKNNLPIHVFIPFNNIDSGIACEYEFETYIYDLNIEHYCASSLTNGITTFIKNHDVQYILGLHTPFTLDFLPAIAHELHSYCITNIHSLTVENNIIATRSSYYGKLDQHIEIINFPIVLSLLPGSFQPYMIEAGITKKLVHIKSDSIPSRRCEFITTENTDSSLDEADVIVGAGKGIGSKDNIDIINEFAKQFQHSTVAGSRIVCDLGWLPYSRQIGITGKSIASKLYIACAISGSSQHISGIKNVKTIVAINKDEHAPIFHVSHYGIVADIFEFIAYFIEYVKNQQKQ